PSHAPPSLLSSATAPLPDTSSPTRRSPAPTLTISDGDSPATSVARAATAGSYGSFSISAAGAWTYTADTAHNEFAAGSTYTDTSAVAAAGATMTAVTINIAGTNDAAVLSAATANLTETDAAADISTSGTLTISDVDSPATFLAQAGTAGSYDTVSAHASTPVTDQRRTSPTTPPPLHHLPPPPPRPPPTPPMPAATITIAGTNDAAVLSAATANLTETDAAADISTSGTLTISDVDSPATFLAQAGTAGSY